MAERFPFPTAEELHDAQMEELKLSLHFAGVGRIQSYDPVHQVADVVPQVRHPWPQPDGTYVFEDLPVLPDVPIVFPRMGKAFLSFPVEPGDAVQLIYDSAAPGAWRRQADSGATGLDRIRELKNPATLQRHHLSNAVAIAGIDIYQRSLTHTLAANATVDAVDTPGIVLGYDTDGGTRVLLKPDGVVDVVHGAAAVFRIEAGAPVAPPQAVALAAATDAIVSSLKSLIAGWTPTGTGDGAALKALIATWSPGTTAASKVKGV